MMAGLRHPDLPPNADLGEIQRSWRELAGQAASDHEAIATQMKQCYEEIAIICFTIEKSQHLMWAHYADKHRGMVIEIESDGVFEPPLEEVTAVNRLYPVSYSPERPIFSFDKLSPAAFITKGMAWEYEHERRVLYFSEKFETRYKDGKELRFRKVPPESFRSVYLGNRVSPEVRGEVLALVGKDPLKHIKVYQMDLDPKGFQLHERQLTNGADPLGKGFRA